MQNAKHIRRVRAPFDQRNRVFRGSPAMNCYNATAVPLRRRFQCSSKYFLLFLLRSLLRRTAAEPYLSNEPALPDQLFKQVSVAST
jgi:hypothetical protein